MFKLQKGFYYKVILTLPVVLCINCVYFNTYYNAHNYFRQATRMVVHDTLKMDHEFFDKTIEKTTAVIVKYPQSRYVDNALYMMGVSYYYKGDYSRALEKLDYVLYNYVDSKFYDDALYFKGLAHYKQGKFNQALIALNEAQEYRRYRIKAKLMLCYTYYVSENYTELVEEAVPFLEKRLSKEERRWMLLILGDAQFKLAHYADAIVSFEGLLDLSLSTEDRREVKLDIAETYLQMGEYAKCRDFLEGEYDPEFRSIFADLTLELGDTAAAKEVYIDVAASGLGDVSAQAYYKIAEVYRGEDSLELAVAYYDSAVFRAPMSEYGAYAKNMASVLRRINDLMAQTEEPDQAQFLMAEIYYIDFKEPLRASEEYQKVYEQFPNSEWAPKALYARFWINHTVLQDSSVAKECVALLSKDYPNTEYSLSARAILGWGKGTEEDMETEEVLEKSDEVNEQDKP